METVGGRYALDGRLGEGGMGHVYRARHLQLGKAFALKIISPAFAADNAARQRFNQEAKLASEISHPNIVSIVDFGEDAQFGAYMVMELVEGEPLIAPGTLPMSVKRATDVLCQVADALDHIHKRGIIHGDVKAENIMLTDEQTSTSGGSRRRRLVRLLDFGLARRPDHVEEEGGVSGSPHYLAPERAAGGPASVSSDVYALGVLGYLLLTGTLPYVGSVVEVLMAHIHSTPESISARRREDIDPALEGLIARAMAKDPAQRHGTAAAFRYELNTVMDMLDMGRRRSRTSGAMPPENAREAAITQAFERSRIPQAILSVEGLFVVTNRAFNKFVNRDDKGCDGLLLSDTTLTTFVPGLVRALRSAYGAGKPIERRAQVFRGASKPPYELSVWLTPLPMLGQEIHLLVRVEEVEAERTADRATPVEREASRARESTRDREPAPRTATRERIARPREGSSARDTPSDREAARPRESARSTDATRESARPSDASRESASAPRTATRDRIAPPREASDGRARQPARDTGRQRASGRQPDRERDPSSDDRE